MLKIGTIPVVDESFLKAVKYALDQIGITPERLPQKKRRTALDGVGFGGGSEYNGYFTIKLRTVGEGDDATQNIVVCDGMTYDNEEGTSDVSLASVNGKSYEVAYFEMPAADALRYIVAEFIPPVYDEDQVITTDAEVKISTCTNVWDYENNIESPDDSITERFCTVIGEVKITEDGDIKIIQRHGTASSSVFNNGEICIEYYAKCFD